MLLCTQIRRESHAEWPTGIRRLYFSRSNFLSLLTASMTAFILLKSLRCSNLSAVSGSPSRLTIEKSSTRHSRMKTKVLFSLALLAAGSLLAADSSPKDDVIAAAKKLAEKDNYSWKTTVVVP